MRNIRKTGTAAGIAALAAISLAACSTGDGGTSEGDGISLAYIYGNESDPFWPSIACGAAAEADELGVTLDIYAQADQDATKMGQSLDAALLKSPDGLIVTPLNGNQFIAQYQQQMAAGVPVVSGQVTDPASTIGVVWSTGEGGTYVEDALAALPEGAGKVIVLGGVQGLTPVESRYFPLVDAIKAERPDLDFLEFQYSGFDPQKAQAAVASLMIANPDVSLVIAATGPDGQGAAAAIKAADAGDTVTLISYDATPNNVDALKTGDIDAIISQNPFEIGRQQVKMLVEYLEAHPDGGAVEATDDFVGIPQAFLTADNVDDPENAPFVYRAQCG